jgi:ribosomal protein L34
MRRICLAWWPFPPHDLQGAVTVALSSHLGDDSPTGVEEESLPDGSPREEGEALRQHLAVLFRSHRDVLLGQALAILRCPFDAEDAVQIAFSRALIGGRPAHALSVGYLARAVTNAARDLLRRRKSAERCRQVLSGMNAPPPGPLSRDFGERHPGRANRTSVCHPSAGSAEGLRACGIRWRGIPGAGCGTGPVQGHGQAADVESPEEDQVSPGGLGDRLGWRRVAGDGPGARSRAFAERGGSSDPSTSRTPGYRPWGSRGCRHPNG